MMWNLMIHWTSDLSEKSDRLHPASSFQLCSGKQKSSFSIQFSPPFTTGIFIWAELNMPDFEGKCPKWLSDIHGVCFFSLVVQSASMEPRSSCQIISQSLHSGTQEIFMALQHMLMSWGAWLWILYATAEVTDTRLKFWGLSFWV